MNEGLNEAASGLVLQDIRSSTSKVYECTFKKFKDFCFSIGENPVKCPIAIIVNFLATLIRDRKLAHTTIGVYSSAISRFHEPINDEPTAKHPLIKRLLKGYFNAAQPLPKYQSTWDVGIVLDYF